MLNFKISNKKIGTNSRCFIVAELSGNHNGDINRIKKMILAAKKANADAIKLQTYTPDTITLKSNKKDFLINKKTPWKKEKNLWYLYKKAHTPYEWHSKIFQFCKKNEILVFSSPFDETAVELLESLKCPAYKIASPEINHLPLIEKIAKTKKPVIISTGLASKREIENAIKILKKYKSFKIILLQCVSAYPSPVEEQNLRKIVTFKKRYNVLSGLSDHTKTNIAPLASVAIGAKVIEKHFKLNDSTKSVDSFFSLNSNEFSDMVKDIRILETALGNGKIEISKSSKKNINSKRSIYVSKKILKGETITAQNIKIVRPGFSLDPKYFNKIIGKKTLINLNIGDRIKFEDLA